ncbi:MAG TPA: hypothetical protein VIW47_11240 [Nitrospiraceae bacterium]|jgi:hypothetical protein
MREEELTEEEAKAFVADQRVFDDFDEESPPRLWQAVEGCLTLIFIVTCFVGAVVAFIFLD